MKEQIVQTEHQYPVNTERERYGRPVQASVGRLRGRNGLHPLDSEVCHRLHEEQLPIRTLKGVVPPTVRVWRTA